jgi:hypothetical protein
MASKIRIIALLLLPLQAWGFNFFPWFGEDFTFEITPYYAFRHFPNVNTDNPHYRAHESGNLIGSDITITALREYTLGVATSLAQTTKMQFGLNSVNFMLGYQFANDRLGDPLAAAGYFVVNANGSRATRDLLLYHSARWELEGHFSFGKECTCVASWSNRGWLDLGLGFGTTGAPYMKGLLVLERNFDDCFLVGAFAKTWVGFGTRQLKEPFLGYGSIRHRNLEVGLRYLYNTFYWGSLGADLSLGVIASNYPRLPIEGRLFWTFNVGP